MMMINKKKIEKMRKRYKKMEMSDDTAAKLVRLDTVNSLLKIATGGVGLITVIDFFVPDPVFCLDEAALTALTGLLGYVSSIINNKMEAIANSDYATLQMNEINTLTKQVSDVVSKVKSK